MQLQPLQSDKMLFEYSMSVQASQNLGVKFNYKRENKSVVWLGRAEETTRNGNDDSQSVRKGWCVG